jgi:DNA polymerase-3 subunit chi
MTRVSFYLLKGSVEHDRQVFACRLIEKAYKQGHHIYIHTDNAEKAEQVNQILWSFRADSFVPHQLIDAPNADNCPVLIGHNTKPPRLMDLLINLGTEQPIFFSQFERVAEFINDDQQLKIMGRERYRFYQQRGYELSTHKI